MPSEVSGTFMQGTTQTEALDTVYYRGESEGESRAREEVGEVTKKQ